MPPLLLQLLLCGWKIQHILLDSGCRACYTITVLYNDVIIEDFLKHVKGKSNFLICGGLQEMAVGAEIVKKVFLGGILPEKFV